MTGALGLRQVPRLGRMTAFGAERKRALRQRLPLTTQERSFVLGPSDGKVCPIPDLASTRRKIGDAVWPR